MVPELFYKNVPESLMRFILKIVVLYYPWQGYLMCSKFWAPYYLNLQCDFQCKTCLAKYDLGNSYVKSLPTPWLAMKKKRI